jgi:ATP-dependent protease HslVU (ClpYQ) peptidase subunit
MTTIAYRDGELATDSRITAGDMIVSDKRRKVHRLRDGSLVAWAGAYRMPSCFCRRCARHPTTRTRS